MTQRTMTYQPHRIIEWPKLERWYAITSTHFDSRSITCTPTEQNFQNTFTFDLKFDFLLLLNSSWCMTERYWSSVSAIICLNKYLSQVYCQDKLISCYSMLTILFFFLVVSYICHWFACFFFFFFVIRVFCISIPEINCLSNRHVRMLFEVYSSAKKISYVMDFSCICKIHQVSG